MFQILHYMGHPSPSSSRINAAMWQSALQVEGVTHIDLYREYPRYDINVPLEQKRLREHDVVVLQFPLFWYSCPALVKEWIDMVWARGFAYGDGGVELHGKTMLLAISINSSLSAYRLNVHQQIDLRSTLSPFELAAQWAGMSYLPPYILCAAAHADPGAHAAGFARVLAALRDNRLNHFNSTAFSTMSYESLHVMGV